MVLLLGVLDFAVTRPRALPEMVAALLTAVLVLATGALSRSEAAAEIRSLLPVVGFLAAILVFADACDEEGLSSTPAPTWGRPARDTRGDCWPVGLLVASLSTAALSLDATVVLRPPVVVGTPHSGCACALARTCMPARTWRTRRRAALGIDPTWVAAAGAVALAGRGRVRERLRVRRVVRAAGVDFCVSCWRWREQPDAGSIKIGAPSGSPVWTRPGSAFTRTRPCGSWSPTAATTSQVGRVEMPARAYLAAFGFRGRARQKPARLLSGGERNRLNLALTRQTRRWPAPARRTRQRPRRGDTVRVGERAAGLPRPRCHHRPRPVDPRPARHPHSRLGGAPAKNRGAGCGSRATSTPTPPTSSGGSGPRRVGAEAGRPHVAAHRTFTRG